MAFQLLGARTLAVFAAGLLVCACTSSNGSKASSGKPDTGTGAGGAGGSGGAGGTGGTGGTGGSGGNAPERPCERAADCDAVSATLGFLCDDGECRPCTTDRECQRIPYYGEATACVDGQCRLSDPCEDSRVADCACDAARPCAEGLTCGLDGKCAADPCTLPGAMGAQGCPCPEMPALCQAGLSCAADTGTCQPCVGPAGCDCPCDEGLTCDMGGRCIAPACASGALDCECQAGDSCDAGLYCEAGTCRACAGGRVEGCPCEAGVCRDLVCDSNECRAAKTCADLAEARVCGENRDCVPGADATRDASCGGCALGYIEQAGACVRDMARLPVCDPRSVNDISAACDMNEHRDCVLGADGAAVCGACLPGYIEVGGICEAQRDCADAGCAAANRECDGAAGAHARCLGCLAGYALPVGCAGPECACEPIPGLTCEDIMPPCAESHRQCDDADGSASCIGCDVGFIDDPAVGGCRPLVTCADLGCEARLNRPCVPGGVGTDARCDVEACQPGFVAEPPGAEACVARTPCRPSPCRADQTCSLVGGVAVCQDPPCADGGARDRQTGACVVCPPNLCNPGPAVTGALLAEGGNCLCQTRPGFYWDVNNGAVSCDEDGDGWVSYVAYQHQTDANVFSASVREQARCDVRTVDRFVLVPERADDADIEILTADRFSLQTIALVETQRNDREAALEQADIRAHPDYAHPPQNAMALGGRGLRPQELNPLTKYCVDEQADYNDDGAADLSQGQGAQPSANLTPAMAAVAASLSYFAELHVGYYLPPEPANGRPFGRYVIAERSRRLDGLGFESVALSLPPNVGEYWRSCSRFVDSNATPDGARCGRASYDYCSDYDAGARTGMLHHSQFKCMAVVRPDRRELEGRPERDSLVSRNAAANTFVFNACTPSAGPADVPAGVSRVNPANVPFVCSTIPPDDRTTLGSPNVDGFVAWAVVPYAPYGGQPTVACADANGMDDDSRCAPGVSCLGGYCQDPTLTLEYSRGCINECEEIAWLSGHDGAYLGEVCAQYREGDDPRFACGVAPFSPADGGPAVPDSGRLVCGCALSYGGEACSIGCGSAGVDGDVLVSGDFNLATRDGDWMCASFNAADSEPVIDAANTWSLSGRVSLSPVTRADTQSGQAADGTTFTVY